MDGRAARKDYKGMGRRSGGDGCVRYASRGDGFMGVQTVNVYGLLNVTITYSYTGAGLRGCY